MQWSLKLFMVDSLLGKKLIIVYVKTFWTYKKIKSLQKGGSVVLFYPDISKCKILHFEV